MKSLLKVQWTQTAKQRLEEIEAFISEDKPVAARKLIRDLIGKAALKLSHYPQIGRSGRIAGTRELVCPDHPFILIYTVRQDTVTVLTVFHSAREFPSSISSVL
jgi:addiction module RelE/StbE family toxin